MAQAIGEKYPRDGAEGVVTDCLPGGFFRVRLVSGKEVLSHVSGKVRRNFLWLRPGDRVRVERAPYNPEHGRIIYRYR